jgi:hypothetical protein
MMTSNGSAAQSAFDAMGSYTQPPEQAGPISNYIVSGAPDGSPEPSTVAAFDAIADDMGTNMDMVPTADKHIV